MHAYEAVGTLMRAWYRRILREQRQIPRPLDEPSVLVGDDAAPLRVLLIGNGPTRGYGVRTHQLALTGQLAREIGTRLASGCRVDYIGDDTLTVATASDWLGDRGDRGYDAAVVVLGISDAATLTPLRTWDDSLRELAARLRAQLGHDARLFIATLPELSGLPRFTGLFGRISQRHADRLNAATLRIAAGTASCHALTVPSPRFEAGRPLGSTEVYARLAAAFADQMQPHLVERGGGTTRPARSALEMTGDRDHAD